MLHRSTGDNKRHVHVYCFSCNLRNGYTAAKHVILLILLRTREPLFFNLEPGALQKSYGITCVSIWSRFFTYLLYAKIGRIAWRHPAIPDCNRTPCQNINFCEFAYDTLILNNHL